ncbi:MAG: hypothetical protein K1X29_09095 [Bdellovibrionales bacterium]|nr:hypothetical protein [Bdellovibrionales bacterium]
MLVKKFKWMLCGFACLLGLAFVFQNCSNSLFKSQQSSFPSVSSTAPNESYNQFQSEINLTSQAIGLEGLNNLFSQQPRNEYKYAYAPSILKENGRWYAFYCSHAESGGIDSIKLIQSDDGLHWTAPEVVLTPSTDTATCDPSVVKYNGGDGNFYYLYYSAIYSEFGTTINVARAPSLTGPYLKLSPTNAWIDPTKNADLKILIKPMHPKKGGGANEWYGAGQQSVMVVDGQLVMFYIDDTAEEKPKKSIYKRTSRDGVNWSTPVKCDLNIHSPDIKYDPYSKRFVMLYIEPAHELNSALKFRTSQDGLIWREAQIICDSQCFPDFSHNVGFDSNPLGHLEGNDQKKILVAYGAPFNLTSNLSWGKWDLYGGFFSLNMNTDLGPEKIIGYTDSVSSSEIIGWSCLTGHSESINVDLYVVSPEGTQKNLGSYLADRSSNDAQIIESMCQAPGKNHRFQIPLSDEIKKTYSGWKVQIYGTSPAKELKNLLISTGEFYLPIMAKENPLCTNGALNYPSCNICKTDQVFFENKCKSLKLMLKGTIIYRLSNSSTASYLYSISPSEGTSQGYALQTQQMYLIESIQITAAQAKDISEFIPSKFNKVLRCNNGVEHVLGINTCPNGAIQESQLGYAFQQNFNGTVPLYTCHRTMDLYPGNIKRRDLFTVNALECDSTQGWTQTNVIGYILPNTQSITVSF